MWAKYARNQLFAWLSGLSFARCKRPRTTMYSGFQPHTPTTYRCARFRDNMMTTSISRTFLIELKMNSQPQYRIAQAAGIHPNMLSKLIHGAVPVRPDDERLVRVGQVLGLSKEEVFA